MYDFATADLAVPPGAIPTNNSYRIYRMPGRLIITEAQASDNNTGYQCIGEIRDAPIRLISAGGKGKIVGDVGVSGQTYNMAVALYNIC